MGGASGQTTHRQDRFGRGIAGPMDQVGMAVSASAAPGPTRLTPSAARWSKGPVCGRVQGWA
eukprot:11540794-Alexandrium_andersonii.AAC.1